jgi:hypothetical protein
MSRANDQIGVVIPTFDRCELLSDALRSLSAQTVRPAEVIVVDNGSTEPVEQTIKRRFPALNIRTYRFDKRVARNVARNKGWRLTQSPLTIFLDDDDCFTFDALASMTVAASAHPNAVAVVAGRSHFGDSTGAPPWIAKNYFGDLFFDVVYGLPFAGPGILFRRAALERAGGLFEEVEIGEDWAGAPRLAALGPFCLLRARLMQVRIWGGPRWTNMREQVADATTAVIREANLHVPEQHRVRFIENTMIAWPEVRKMFHSAWSNEPLSASAALIRALRADPFLGTASIFWKVHGVNIARRILGGMIRRGG